MRISPTKELRLNKQQFRRTLQSGMRARLADMKVFYTKNELTQARYAVGVGKKFGNAVERNYHKRLLREAYRSVQPTIPSGFDIVIIAYEKDIPLSLRSTQLKKLLMKLGIITTKNKHEDL
jgi:ribonuclease P protein component